MECSMSISASDLAKHYWVDDVPGATTAGSRLNNLLTSLGKGQPMTATSRSFLASRGLNTLVCFLAGELSQVQFNQLAQVERDRRIALAQQQQLEMEAQKMAEQSAADAREAAMWARLEAERIQRESDPWFIAKKKNQELRRKYGLEVFVEEHHFKRLMSILRKLDSKSRLSEIDTLWLRSEGRDYETEEILHAHHRLEAEFCIAEYKRTNDPWQAVNASAHLRKCAAPEQAIELLSAIPVGRQDQAKLKSAIRTTHGGALRDLGHFTEALKMGEQAHALLPNNFRPCTLLGALNIELGNFEVGHEWYRMAEARGAKPDSIEHEVRSLLARMSAEKRDEAMRELLRIDPVQYCWLRKGQPST
jgi:tetratricopeptide (TPR) repeat protein